MPEPFPYKEARELFLHPEVLKADDVPALKWSTPDLGESHDVALGELGSCIHGFLSAMIDLLHDLK